MGTALISSLNFNEIKDLFTSSYIIPEEFKEIVKKAINQYSQPNKKSEEKLNELVNKSYSPLDTFNYLTTNNNGNFNQWNGHLAEWITCFEYNSGRNNDSVVFTFVNPDTTSKADLLHIIKVGKGFKCVAGADIKTGSPKYVLDQLEKVWKHEGSIPFFDYHNTLQNKERLTQKQRERLVKLEEKYPKKRIITSRYSREEQIKFSHDYLSYVAKNETGNLIELINSAKQNIQDYKRYERSWMDFNQGTIEKFKVESEVKGKQSPDKVVEGKGKGSKKSWFVNELIKSKNWLMKKSNNAIRHISENKCEIIEGVVHIVVETAVNKGTEKLFNYKQNQSNNVLIESNDLTETPKVNTNSKLSQPEPLKSDSVKRASPREHEVDGYFKQNGTYVKSYPRGGNKENK
ncbi:hypothetical protein [Schinkia azotoformans]|uniref:hypothetical protein n=1 Tax=Schinkia azotoformans TaxID=1454 RepID=UPI002DBF8455|nr:hypothetical protein [Schinkia azotoformans]MEC1716499.1 hypothetical protein [Schinkia azotoformans]MEC1759104.1 hypothetical protein [Schinkia azotoformans]